MDVGDHVLSVRHVGPNLGHDGMGVGDGYVCIYRQFGLEGGVSNSHMEMMKRTLKTLRILLRSAFQAAILSLSFLAWRCREITFRLLCLMTFSWIAATALGIVNELFKGAFLVQLTSSAALLPQARSC